MADGAVILDGALALDGRVEAGVVVDFCAVRGGAGAGIAADVPCRRRCLAELGEHRVHRRRCKPSTSAAEIDTDSERNFFIFNTFLKLFLYTCLIFFQN